MKNSIKLLGVAVIALGAFAGNAFAQCSSCASSSASVDVYARIVTPIHVVGEEEMNFGAVCAPATGTGTAVLTTDHTSGTGDGGTITYNNLGAITQGSIGHDPLDGDGIEEARFVVTGEPTLTYGMVITSTGLAKMVGSGSPLGIGAFTTNYGGPGPQTVGTLPASGSQEVNVGATLTVPAGQPAGWYHGTINLTATYN